MNRAEQTGFNFESNTESESQTDKKPKPAGKITTPSGKEVPYYDEEELKKIKPTKSQKKINDEYATK